MSSTPRTASATPSGGGRRTCGDGVVLVEVPGGAVDLRDDRTGRRWTVAVAPLAVAEVPVTQDLYAAVTGRRPSAHRGGSLPVEDVSWVDAVRFCDLLSLRHGLAPAYGGAVTDDAVTWDATADGYRLPTEAEWVHACRAGTTDVRYGELDEIAWYADNAGGRPREVGSKAPNAWGLHDMLGNVWEWCWDLYDVEVYGAYRIMRGGGWADPARGVMVTNRRRSHPTFGIDDLGFRVVRS